MGERAVGDGGVCWVRFGVWFGCGSGGWIRIRNGVGCGVGKWKWKRDGGELGRRGWARIGSGECAVEPREPLARRAEGVDAGARWVERGVERGRQVSMLVVLRAPVADFLVGAVI